MKIPSSNDIVTTDTVQELAEILDKAPGWVLVEETGGDPIKLG